jgi:CHAD domain-containing protein
MGVVMGVKRLNKFARKILKTIEQKHNDLIHHQKDEETIHDLRVAIRRLMPVLDILIRLEDRENKKNKLIYHRNKLKNTFKVLSGPRDLEVQIKLANRWIEKYPNQSSEITRYIDCLIVKKNLLDGQLVDVINQMALPKSTIFIDKYVKNNFMNKDYLKKNIVSTYDRLTGSLRKSLDKLKNDLSIFHEVRIKFKKIKYFLELSAEISGLNDQRLVLLKQLQDELGDTNDLAVALQLMDKNKVNLDVINLIEIIYKKNIKQSVKHVFSTFGSLNL